MAELCSIDSSLIRKLEPARLGVTLKKRPKFVYKHVVPGLPDIGNVRRRKYASDKSFPVKTL
jgi:hypothetical protein